MASFSGGSIPLAAVVVQSLDSGTQTGNVNVGLSQALGSAVSAQSGLNLTGGQDYLQTQLTPLLTATLSNQLSSTLENTLGSVGAPVASLVSSLSSSFMGGGGFSGGGLAGGLGGLLGGLGGGLGGNVINDVASKIWPGGGGEGSSDYGGFMHNLGPNGPDVVFSIVPANHGPQTQGVGQAANLPTVPTTLPSNSFTGVPPNFVTPSWKEVSSFKYTAMTSQGGK